MNSNKPAGAFRHPTARILIAAISGFFLLTGCSGFTIDEDMRIPLEKDTLKSGSHSEFDFDLDYRYTFRQTDPSQPGELKLYFTLQRKSSLYSLSVFVNFLDAQGQVLDKNMIYGLSNRKGIVQVGEDPMQTPPGTVAIAFTSVSRDFKSKQ